MASVIRKVVSKNKRRYQENGFDLDLSYITPRIIAMGFPAERSEAFYRNPIDEVVRFLEFNHRSHYKVYNLCRDRSYSEEKFHGRVTTYALDDHHPPNLELMLPFCQDVDRWLGVHTDNVVAVHCKAGKGRTGVMICAYLLYKKISLDVPSVLRDYGLKRTHDSNGVTIPSQQRYVSYFNTMLHERLRHRKIPMLLRSIHFENYQPSILSEPYFVVYEKSKEKRVYKSAVYDMRSSGFRAPIGGGGSGSSHHQNMALNPVFSINLALDNVHVQDDVRILFKQKRMQRQEKLFHFWFNTFFYCPGRVANKTPLNERKSDPPSSSGSIDIPADDSKKLQPGSLDDAKLYDGPVRASSTHGGVETNGLATGSSEYSISKNFPNQATSSLLALPKHSISPSPALSHQPSSSISSVVCTSCEQKKSRLMTSSCEGSSSFGLPSSISTGAISQCGELKSSTANGSGSTIPADVLKSSAMSSSGGISISTSQSVNVDLCDACSSSSSSTVVGDQRTDHSPLKAMPSVRCREPRSHHMLTLTKYELDGLPCKDKPDKKFPDNFTVHVILSCLDENCPNSVPDFVSGVGFANRSPSKQSFDSSMSYREPPISVSARSISLTTKSTLSNPGSPTSFRRRTGPLENLPPKRQQQPFMRPTAPSFSGSTGSAGPAPSIPSAFLNLAVTPTEGKPTGASRKPLFEPKVNISGEFRESWSSDDEVSSEDDTSQNELEDEIFVPPVARLDMSQLQVNGSATSGEKEKESRKVSGSRPSSFRRTGQKPSEDTLHETDEVTSNVGCLDVKHREEITRL